MRSARSLYRLSSGLAALGMLSVAAALFAALRAIGTAGLSMSDFMNLCRQVAPSGLSAVAVAVFMLTSVSAAAVIRGIVAAGSHARRSQRFLAALPVLGDVEVDGLRVLVIDDDTPHAFCGGLLRPRVYLSTGALACLGDDELRAVLEHERHHRSRRDPLRILLADVLASALFFLPVLGRLNRRYAELAELAADDAAVRSTGSRRPLASALLAFGAAERPGVVVGIAPARVDHLLGRPPRWEMPVFLLFGGIMTILGLLAVSAITAAVAGSGTVALPMLLAEACMVGMTVVPIGVGVSLLLIGVRSARRR